MLYVHKKHLDSWNLTKLMKKFFSDRDGRQRVYGSFIWSLILIKVLYFFNALVICFHCYALKLVIILGSLGY